MGQIEALLAADHARLDVLLSAAVPPPDHALVRELRALLGPHDAKEQGPGGMYAVVEELAGDDLPALVDALVHAPWIRPAPHLDRRTCTARRPRRCAPCRASRRRSDAPFTGACGRAAPSRRRPASAVPRTADAAPRARARSGGRAACAASGPTDAASTSPARAAPACRARSAAGTRRFTTSGRPDFARRTSRRARSATSRTACRPVWTAPGRARDAVSRTGGTTRAAGRRRRFRPTTTTARTFRS